MLRGTLRKGAFGQQCAFNEQLRQWRMLAIYRSVSPSLTSLPVVVSVLPAGQVYRFRSLSNVKSSRLKIPSSRTDLSFTGMCGAIFFSLTIQLSVGAYPYAESAVSSFAFIPHHTSV